MPKNLKRYYGLGHLHFVTFSCYRRLPLLGTARSRDAFVRVLEEVRAQYGFALIGFVVMPEHVHLLIGETQSANPSTVVQSLKLRVSRKIRPTRRRTSTLEKSFALDTGETPFRFWQSRFYDFNVFSTKKRREKLEYMHRNPVTRGLVDDPKDWVWSSYACYSSSATPLLHVDLVA